MLLDSNIIIYAAQPQHEALRVFIARNDCVVSAVSYVEVLGYHALKPAERQLLEQFFEAVLVLPIDQRVLDQAVRIRQQRRTSLGDALVAATALVYEQKLVTHNTADFNWIDNLAVVDPLAQ